MKLSNSNLNYSLRKSDIQKSNFDRFLNDISDIPSIEMNGSLEEAGVINQNIIIKVRNLFNSPINYLYCDLKLCVSLDSYKGIHMSRIEEVLFSLVDDEYESLEVFAERLSENLRVVQKSKSSLIEISATTFMGRTTRKSGKISKDKINLFCKVENNNGVLFFTKGIQAYNMTACPCTATYTKFHTVPALRDRGFNLEDINFILSNVVTGTHTQRGKIFLVISNVSSNLVSYKDLYDVIDKSSHLVHELLKRPDEHELVIRALKSPQFTEDVVRDVAKALVDNLKSKIDDNSIVTIESTQLDSIHIHDVYSKISRKFIDLRSEY